MLKCIGEVYRLDIYLPQFEAINVEVHLLGLNMLDPIIDGLYLRQDILTQLVCLNTAYGFVDGAHPQIKEFIDYLGLIKIDVATAKA